MDKQTFYKILRDLEQIDAADGLDISELLLISGDLRALLTWMVRKNLFDANELAKHLEVDKSSVKELLAVLLQRGFVQITDAEQQVKYQTRLTGSYKRRYKVKSDLWKLIED